MSDICGKFNFIINYKRFTTTNPYIIKTHTYCTKFDTLEEFREKKKEWGREGFTKKKKKKNIYIYILPNKQR